MVHSARPLTVSHSSLTSSGVRGATCTRNNLCERKEDVLQTSLCKPGLHLQIVEGAGASNATIGQEDEAITNTLCIRQLMYRKRQCSAGRRLPAQHVDNLASLSKVEAVKRLIHNEHRMR